MLVFVNIDGDLCRGASETAGPAFLRCISAGGRNDAGGGLNMSLATHQSEALSVQLVSTTPPGACHPPLGRFMFALPEESVD